MAGLSDHRARYGHDGSIPARAGIGLRAAHHDAVLAERPRVGFLEAHSENYFGGGRSVSVLQTLRADYPISLHGVGLALGATDPLDEVHLAALVALVERIEPALVSEHLAWSVIGGRHYNDLLPLPWTGEALAHLAARIDRVQACLGRRILVENLSSYVQFRHSTMPEWEFLAALAATTGCALLLDVNNVYVSSVNHGFDPRTYIDAIPPAAVAELHLAGHTEREQDGVRFLLDTHDGPVAAEVWALHAHAIARIGAVPTLIEWDSALPPLATLVAQAQAADRLREQVHVHAA